MSELGIRNVRLTPGGGSVTWLAGGEDGPRVLDLWTIDVASGQSRVLVRSADLISAAAESLSDEEKARRERLRISDVGGIVEYEWSASGDALLFPLGGHLYLVEIGPAGQRTKQLTKIQGEVIDAHFSPKGQYVSYVRDRHLWVVELATGVTTRLSSDLKPEESAGSAEFIAQEEMHRFSGYWWSPNDISVAFTVVDESPVAIAKRIEVYADRFETIEQRYPYAGGKNAAVRLVLKSLGGASVDAKLPPFEYLARVGWDLKGEQVYVQTQDRAQTTLTLSAVDVKSGASRELLVERDAAWINLHEDFRPLPDGGFVWASERSGYKHLETRNGDGSLRAVLTAGDWVVQSVRAVDVKQGVIYFDGFRDSPLELHLYALGLDKAGIEPKRLTAGQGWHETTVGAEGTLWVDVYSTPTAAPTIRLFSGDGQKLADLGGNGAGVAQDGTKELTIGSFRGPDGTELYYRIRKPKGAKEGVKYPAVVYVYGGPGAQVVQRRWLPRADAIESKLADAGFVVFAMDNRGSPHRGKRFEGVLKSHFAGAELEDQAAGVRWLQQQDFVDGERVGICGASYGGFMTLMALLREPSLYKVGVSIAPVTDWALYDTHYTERYLGHPETNAAAYARSAVLPYVDGLVGKLLVIHGMADDNVLYTHSTKLYKALQDAGKMFDIMVYPGEKHGITGAKAKSHELNALVGYFVEHLQGG